MPNLLASSCSNLLNFKKGYPRYIVECSPSKHYEGKFDGVIMYWSDRWDMSDMMDSIPHENYGEFGYSDELPDPPMSTDEHCKTLDSKSLRVSDGFQSGSTVSAGGCDWVGTIDPSVSVQFPNGDWLATFDPIGASPDAPSTPEELSPPPPDLDNGWVPSSDIDLTPTSDPSQDCPFSNVSSGNGDTYCYEGEDANVGSDYPDGSTRVDHYDGSYTITEPSGVSTSYNPDGTVKEKTTAPTAPGAGPSGDGTQGSDSGLLKTIADGISDLAGSISQGFGDLDDSMSEGFEGLEESLTEEAPDPDSMLSESGLNDIADNAEQEAETHGDNVLDQLDQIGSDESSSIAQQVVSKFPSLPGGSCTSLTFNAGFTTLDIPCQPINTVRDWLGWIIYFWTVVSIMNTFFAPSTRRA